MRAAPVALLLALSTLSAGCVSIVAAHVPDKFLEGRGGNGWEKNMTASQAEPDSGTMGLQKTQSLVYEDRVADPGYPGVLVISTLRAVPSPSGERIKEHVQDAIKTEAEKKGIALSGSPRTGERTLANGARSSWFTYTGNVSSTGGFFARNAEVKIFGEVFECHAHKTIVATVGMAQVTDERTVGPAGGLLPSPNTRDTTTWREIVADPNGAIEGLRGNDGLAHHVVC